jgi:hypothetical protein
VRCAAQAEACGSIERAENVGAADNELVKRSGDDSAPNAEGAGRPARQGATPEFDQHHAAGAAGRG